MSMSQIEPSGIDIKAALESLCRTYTVDELASGFDLIDDVAAVFRVTKQDAITLLEGAWLLSEARGTSRFSYLTLDYLH